MKCDYDALIDYATVLNQKFNNIKNAISDIESSASTIYNTTNWNSETRDYFVEQFSTMLDNFDTINNKFLNITQYIDTVIDNYKQLESQLSGYFGE
jgi:uncharacterized protein YukE